jgi:DNA-directed RNA polymerase subunit RPC12/RpoP
MEKQRTIQIRNGDMWVNFTIYTCEACKKDVRESDVHHIEKTGEVFCWDCAFKRNKISGDEYIKWCSIKLTGLRATVYNDEIYLTTSKYFPFERQHKRRNQKVYSEWRTSVFQRDNFTCQNCGIRGSELNAHHIKSYMEYPDMRHDINNGITLCKACHIEEHKRLRRENV